MPKNDWDALGPAKPTKLRAALKDVVEKPEKIGMIVSSVASKEHEDGEAKHTTVPVEIGHVQTLDSIAKNLSMTRNGLISLVLRGLAENILGVVH